MSEAREIPEALRALLAAEPTAEGEEVFVPITRRITFLNRRGQPVGCLDPEDGLILRVLTITDGEDRPIARLSADEDGLVFYDPEWKHPYHRRLRLSQEGLRINDRSGKEAAFLGWGSGVGPHLHMYSVLSGDSDPLIDLSITEEWEDREAWGTVDLYDEGSRNVASLPGDLHGHDEEDELIVDRPDPGQPPPD